MARRRAPRVSGRSTTPSSARGGGSRSYGGVPAVKGPGAPTPGLGTALVAGATARAVRSRKKPSRPRSVTSGTTTARQAVPHVTGKSAAPRHPKPAARAVRPSAAPKRSTAAIPRKTARKAPSARTAATRTTSKAKRAARGASAGSVGTHAFKSRAQWRFFFANPRLRRYARKKAHKTEATRGGPKVAYRSLPWRKRAPTARTVR